MPFIHLLYAHATQQVRHKLNVTKEPQTSPRLVCLQGNLAVFFFFFFKFNNIYRAQKMESKMWFPVAHLATFTQYCTCYAFIETDTWKSYTAVAHILWPPSAVLQTTSIIRYANMLANYFSTPFAGFFFRPVIWSYSPCLSHWYLIFLWAITGILNSPTCRTGSVFTFKVSVMILWWAEQHLSTWISNSFRHCVPGSCGKLLFSSQTLRL